MPFVHLHSIQGTLRHKTPAAVSQETHRMKLKNKLTASLVALGITAVVSAQDTKNPDPKAMPAPTAPAAATAPQYTEPQLLETFGWFIGKRIGLAELGFSAEQTQSIVKGLIAASGGKEPPFDLQKIGPEMDKFMQEKQQQYMSKLREQSQVDTDKFFKEVKTKPGVIVLPSGVAYEIVQPGSGEYPKPTNIVRVNYTGTLINGTTFDKSNEPVEFPLNEVIPGWTEGIQKINKGGKIKLYIPPQSAYGDEPKPGIPAGSTLIFDVELLDIKTAPTPTPTPAPTPIPAPAGAK